MRSPVISRFFYPAANARLLARHTGVGWIRLGGSNEIRLHHEIRLDQMHVYRLAILE